MQVFDKYGVPTVLIYVSNVYLSCIYRICNVVDRGNSAIIAERLQRSLEDARKRAIV